MYAASVADYEEGNKAPFCSFESEIEQNRINPEFAQWHPDALNFGKSLKAGFLNWYLKLRKEICNVTITRSLWNKSTSKEQTEIGNYLLENDYVRERDHQYSSSALALKKPLLTFYQFTRNNNNNNNKSRQKNLLAATGMCKKSPLVFVLQNMVGFITV